MFIEMCQVRGPSSGSTFLDIVSQSIQLNKCTVRIPFTKCAINLYRKKKYSESQPVCFGNLTIDKSTTQTVRLIIESSRNQNGHYLEVEVISHLKLECSQRIRIKACQYQVIDVVTRS